MNFLLFVPAIMGLAGIASMKGDPRKGQAVLVVALAISLGLCYFFLDMKTVLLVLAMFAVSEVLHLVLAGTMGRLLTPDVYLFPVALMGLFPPFFSGWWIGAVVTGVVTTVAVLFYAHRQRNLVRAVTSTD